MAQVSFDGVTVAIDDVQNNPARYARQLQRAKKSPGYARCRCKPDGAGKLLRLAIRRYGALFHLARWPEEGPYHDAQLCPLYASAAVAGKKKSDASEAIQQTPSGLNVKLDASLSVRTVEHSPRLSANASGTGRTRRAAPLLGFLQRVWIEADLHIWMGAPARSWGQCNAQVVAALGVGKLNGKPMQDVLHVMRHYEENEAQSIVAEFDDFLGRIKTTPAVSQRGLVLGELRSVMLSSMASSSSFARQSAPSSLRDT
jgi:hypothetical protein